MVFIMKEMDLEHTESLCLSGTIQSTKLISNNSTEKYSISCCNAFKTCFLINCDYRYTLNEKHVIFLTDNRKGQMMETIRNDVKRDKREIVVKNSSYQGFSSTRLNKGDMFVYQYIGTPGEWRYAMCHGRIKPISDEKGGYLILAQVLSHNLQFSYERWIKPEDVIETIPAERINPLLSCLFLEYEMNQR
jgi:hypothetical protein